MLSGSLHRASPHRSVTLYLSLRLSYDSRLALAAAAAAAFDRSAGLLLECVKKGKALLEGEFDSDLDEKNAQPDAFLSIHTRGKKRKDPEKGKDFF